MTNRLCTTCKFCLYEDYGWSNWTVEGTSLYCLQGLNSAIDGMDEYRPVESALRVAENCPSYAKGKGPSYDVDGDTTAEDYKNDPEVYALLVARREAK